MELDLLKAKRDDASRDEDFWWSRHRDCAGDAAAKDDYGWLWLNARQRRQKLDLMIQKQRSPA